MADYPHLKVLEKGGEAWNRWRRGHPSLRPDLKGIHLFGVDLRGIDFSHTNLSYSTLNDSNLSGADLTSTELHFSRLKCVNLSKANLTSIDLSTSELWDVNLSQANVRKGELSLAYIHDSDLSEADLRSACLGGTVLLRTSLRGAKITGCKTEEMGVALWQVDLTDAVHLETLQPDPALYEYYWGRYERHVNSKTFPIAVEDPELLTFLKHLFIAQAEHDDREYPLYCATKPLNTSLVLILGYFEGSRKAIADTLCACVLARGYVPMLGDGAYFTLMYREHHHEDKNHWLRGCAHLADFVLVDHTGLDIFNEEEDMGIWDDFNIGVMSAKPASAFQFLLQGDARSQEQARADSDALEVPLSCYEDASQLMAFLQEEGITALKRAIQKEL